MGNAASYKTSKAVLK